MTELLTPNELANALKVDRITIYRWVKGGRIQASKLPDGQIRIPIEQLEKLLIKKEV